MEIIKTNKEPHYKKVKVSELKKNEAFESNNELHIVLYNDIERKCTCIYTPSKSSLEPVTYWECIDEHFPDAILCNIKILYERMLE